jgi:acylphosphatase
MIEEHAGFKVQGKVQGVGFRMWVRHTGTGLGLRGSVRNLEDGSVEVHVAGPASAARGPPGITSHALSQARTTKRSSLSMVSATASTIPRASVHSSGVVLWLRSRTKA